MILQSAEEYLKEKGINPKEPIFWYSGIEYLTMEQAMTEYAKLYASEKVKEALKVEAEMATCSDASWDAIPKYTIDTNSILDLETELLNNIDKEI